jgi:hypothetical protein
MAFAAHRCLEMVEEAGQVLVERHEGTSPEL